MDRLVGADEGARSADPADEAGRAEGLARDVTAIKIGDCLLGYKAVQRRMRGGRWNHFRGRMREIEKLIRHRHGDIVPEADDAFIYVEVIAGLAFVEFGEDFVEVVLGWAARWLPWAEKAAIEVIIYERTKLRFSPLTADALGHALHQSFAERSALDIRTIGAFDVPKAKRARLQKEKRRQRDRNRKEERRRAAGAVSRADYLDNSLSAARPWEAFGISRRTWERRGKPMPEPMPDVAPISLAA
ncbi:MULTISPECIES: hypothetical protein [Rhizobium]|uniref:hypothetical protein n=1 Tax=Rhizobium TaxID=379 RepID=UPI001B32199B|nr:MULTISPECIES: hypothetical protein [Rhizobium]MBX4906919.1 hypothetical protein [Rhizobium bangladeshense]MBX5234171.1 hypothetical protein [Rhizobium sp. NLR4a]MBX5239908.1 hypothetical protein [Rhizobium sp. NLR22b]MBX5253970.1 hypothetical protein [Rhizobium sp. NLR4b]MBX5255976.1 hypothetical protein [Rhizobium sp. NLR16b]